MTDCYKDRQSMSSVKRTGWWKKPHRWCRHHPIPHRSPILPLSEISRHKHSAAHTVSVSVKEHRNDGQRFALTKHHLDMSDTHKGESEPKQKAVQNSQIVERILKPHIILNRWKGFNRYRFKSISKQRRGRKVIKDDFGINTLGENHFGHIG